MMTDQTLARLILYDYAASGNCLKVRLALRHLERSYERVGVDIFGGDTLTEEFTRLNPERLVPLLVVDNTPLAESGAILWYLAEGTPYLPADPLARSEVVRWLLFEQGPIAHCIAAVRFRLQVGLFSEGEPVVVERRRAGGRALMRLDEHLTDREFLVGDGYTIADMATYGYVHVAPEAGYDLQAYPAVSRWLRRVESQAGFVNDLRPLDPTARPGRGLSVYG